MVLHTKHDIELAHLPIPENVRTKIAAKLEAGVNIDRILDDIRDDIPDGKVNRQQLLKKQDIHNLKRQLNISGIQKHKNSVCALVEEAKALEYNPILLFKPQGEDQPEGMDNIGKQDFLLCLQTEFQCDALEKYGNNVVCMDATHGTTSYNFQLITILVMDEYEEGIPVAWAISNREDAMVLTQFLTAVKSRLKETIEPKYLMTDDAQQYFTAWTAAFGSQHTKKLLCSWHVDRAWRKSVNQHIDSQQERIESYHFFACSST